MESQDEVKIARPMSPNSAERMGLVNLKGNFGPIADPDTNNRAMVHESLVTMRLSETPTLHVDTTLLPKTSPSRRSPFGPEYTPTNAMAEPVPEEDEDDTEEYHIPGSEMRDEDDGDGRTPTSGRGKRSPDNPGPKDIEDEDDDARNAMPRDSSDEEDVVNWDQLQKTENEESQDQDSDNNTALLLARLEQENERIATNPKSVKVQVVERQENRSRAPRPPSMAQLHRMVNGPTPSALRYSMLPPPPMTDMDFYMALVKDYQQTAARLPTLLSNKIRKGIPPPLRGVVWQSMSGARDSALEEMFDRLSGESSPYEGMIGKDLGRSFPGIDMFRDSDGEGQRMLGRVLKCFSLYDNKIGYCQGLAFLVGPLLMHMPERQAFCVLIKLMENYDLRQLFVPDLSGLHVRIYQFRELLHQHFAEVAAHLDELQVEPAYVSQWFLSFFAVTCPLPMLFRIYDVVFAEGAPETVMRVALSLMRKNQKKILACNEMEDVMHLLLSRGLWDCYNYNADEFVHDFVSLSEAVSRERLAVLEQGYREAQIASTNPRSIDAARSSDVATAASRFLGRLWAVSSTPRLAPFTLGSSGAISPSASGQQSPGLTAPSRPLSLLRRSASKQSFASTLHSMDVASSATTLSSSASVSSSASTDATSLSQDSATADDSSRDSAPTFSSLNSKTKSVAPTAQVSLNTHGGGACKSDSRHLHSQIEDLLVALSELQRNHALLASELQKEREDRDEDRKAVCCLLEGLRKKASVETVVSNDSIETVTELIAIDLVATSNPSSAEDLSALLHSVEARFGGESTNKRRWSVGQTKSQLLDELARTKEKLSNELAKDQDWNRRLHDIEQEVSSVKDQLRDSHAHVRNLHQEKQRLEKQIHNMRARASDLPSSGPDTSSWFSQGTSAPALGSGLRELRLGRSKSTPSQGPTSTFGRPSSSLMPQKHVGREGLVPGVTPSTSTPGISSNDHETLLLELVQAKTAEAIAKQEAEEAKQKLETTRKAFGLAPGDPLPAAPVGNPLPAAPMANVASSAASAAVGMFGRLTGSTAASDAGKTPPARQATAPSAAPTPAASTGGGGFWGWRR